MSIDQQKLRSWWTNQQGLLKVQEIDAPEILFRRFGWARSLAGCNPYLTAFSRARIDRARVDRAIADLDISELPAARSCTYVVPSSDFATALAMGSAEGELKTAKALGSTDEDLNRLGDAVLKALEAGAKDPAELRTELGSLVANYGEAGQKKGLTTSLPAVLGMLQGQGKIVRRPPSGRLDEQRYAYTLWTRNRPSLGGLDRETALQQCAARFFSWIGPATIGQFATLAGISGRAAKVACEPLSLVPITPDSDLLIFAEELREFSEFDVPTKPVFRLLNRLDSLLLLQSDLLPLFSDEVAEKFVAFGGSESMKELGFNPIVDRGAIVGLWEFDSDNGEVVYVSFVKECEGLRTEIAETQAYIANQLGDARTFSLDSPKSRRPKIEKLRSGVSF